MAVPVFLQSIVEWLRGGYPDGVPEADYVPLLALLNRRLSDDEVQSVMDALIADLQGVAELQSWWEGPQNTEFYFYGPDAAPICAVLETAAARFPLAALSTVEVLA